MPKYLIERNIPGAGKLTSAELQDIAHKSCDILRSMEGVHWVHSYVCEDKLFCIYIAPNKELIAEHARCGGFPADNISEVKRLVDPSTENA